ncbi:hypothetical protein Lw1_gp149 [Escherichia phage Lw1]|uniref:Uncharacterized protein n=1 Tax=Escherichia phage Lw1 TaxID=1307804 RepID=M9UXU5_9CAUD|nr:hypothetical protein Lw1_gp149 [Escherichia phage Lw1]AGJ71556.1 hypothetical protein Lw1_gp149 [Escherichia phage Lw1]
MVQVVKMQPKEVICRKCETLLSYDATDVREETHTDYTGGRDTYRMITCPICHNKIVVK